MTFQPDVAGRPERHPDAMRSAQRSRRHALAYSLVLAATSTLFAVLLAEAVLQLAAWPPRPTSHAREFIEYDETRGWRNVPHADGYLIADEYRVRLTYNSSGIRGPERSHVKPDGVFRIVVTGDSFVEGYTVALEERFAEVLERELARSGQDVRVEVIALGTGGYSTDQELLWLESEGLRYDPDLVINMFYVNDVWYNAQASYWRGGKPLFVFDADTLVLTNVPVPRTEIDEARGRQTLRSLVQEHSKLFMIASAALKSSWRLHALLIRAGLAGVPPEMVLDAGDRVPVPAEFSVYRARPSPQVDYAWTMTAALLARMRQRAREHGAQFLVFMVPLRGDIYRQDATIRVGSGGVVDGFDANAVIRRFHAVCEKEQLDCINPIARFRAAAGAPDAERLYFRHDWHWNAAGHALAADILSEEIRARHFPGTAADGDAW